MAAIEYARDRLLLARTAYEAGNEEQFITELQSAVDRLREIAAQLRGSR